MFTQIIPVAVSVEVDPGIHKARLGNVYRKAGVELLREDRSVGQWFNDVGVWRRQLRRPRHRRGRPAKAGLQIRHQCRDRDESPRRLPSRRIGHRQLNRVAYWRSSNSSYRSLCCLSRELPVCRRIGCGSCDFELPAGWATSVTTAFPIPIEVNASSCACTLAAVAVAGMFEVVFPAEA